MCAYLGAPIPACVAVRNTIVPQARGHDRRVGDYGGPLLSATMDNHWDRSHRGLQRVVAADVRDHGGTATLEVGGLFAAAIDTRYFHECTASTSFLFDKLCPPGKGGVRQFEDSMKPRLAKLGITATDPSALSEGEIERFVRLNIDPESITWCRVTDTNDRFVRRV